MYRVHCCVFRYKFFFWELIHPSLSTSISSDNNTLYLYVHILCVCVCVTCVLSFERDNQDLPMKSWVNTTLNLPFYLICVVIFNF